MATASPTPIGNGLVRRTSQRQALRRLPSRSAVNHNESSYAPTNQPLPNGYHPKPQQFHDDSSEDEIPVPMKLSALTKALLNDGAPASTERPVSPPRTRRRTSALNASTSSTSETRRHRRSGSVQPHDRSSRPTSPAQVQSREISPVRKRVVRLSNTPQSLNQMKPTKRRSTSLSRSTRQSRPHSRPESRDMSSDERYDSKQDSKDSKQDSQLDVNTPAQGGRVVGINAGSPSNRSRLGSTGPSSGRFMDRSLVDRSAIEDNDQPEEPATVARNPPPFHHGSVSRYPSTTTRTRPEDNANLQSSMRVKRVSKVAGSFLSGPARRGRRRQSEEEGEANADGDMILSSQEAESQPADDHHAASYYGDSIRDFNSGSPVSGQAAARAIHRRNASNIDLRLGAARQPSRETSPRESTPEVHVPQPKPEPEQEEEIHYKLPAHRPELPSGRDQENDVQASLKRTKPSMDAILDKMPKRPMSADPAPVRAVSPDRKPLASMARNTPLRQAPPPPPKMSVLEAATATAGAATTTQAKQRRNILRVNGVAYTRLDCLGRGGSGKVYRVAAENGKMFALKRVSLENADDSTIKGYLGEIDLLKKLGEVERVIKLFDCEMNTEKQVLTLVCSD